MSSTVHSSVGFCHKHKCCIVFPFLETNLKYTIIILFEIYTDYSYILFLEHREVQTVINETGNGVKTDNGHQPVQICKLLAMVVEPPIVNSTNSEKTLIMKLFLCTSCALQ